MGKGIKCQQKDFKKKYFQISLFFIFALFFFFYPGRQENESKVLGTSFGSLLTMDYNLEINASPYPTIKSKALFPQDIFAKAVILMDIPSAVVMYQKNSQMKLPPASTTKIMTALVALDYYDLEKIIMVDAFEKRGAQMGLAKGDLVTVRSLFYGMLINSGNDAASVLAYNYPGGEVNFVAKMNEKSQNLSLSNTYFANVVGFDDPNHFTSALDLARLATFSLKNPILAEMVANKEKIVTDVSGKKFYYLKNVNKLLEMSPEVKGIKTGWTEEAGECLVASAEKNGEKLVSVILGSSDRFLETKRLFDWGFNNFTWEKIQATDHL